MADKPKPKPGPNPELRLNRTKHCHLCNRRNIREFRPSPLRSGDHPKGNVDPNYVVAVCPTCDLNNI